MINTAAIENAGPIGHFDSKTLGKINLFIGHNGKGKTFLLKTLYATTKAVEQNNRGRNETKSFGELLSDKLLNTFDVNALGKIVKKGEGNKMHVKIKSGVQSCEYTFSGAAVKQIQSQNYSSSFLPTHTNSIFLPAKEILSLRKVILASRERSEFGFDDTYYDLAKALEPTRKGKNVKAFSDSRGKLMNIIGGRIEYNQDKDEWVFRDSKKMEHDIAVTSEGIKKLSILDSLLGNHYLSRDSIVFIDEPESALHPELISQFLDIIFMLAKAGLQFFIASHSYFVIKKLYLIAHQHNTSIPVYSFDESCCRYDLKNEMPDNPIVGESIRLFEEELEL